MSISSPRSARSAALLFAACAAAAACGGSDDSTDGAPLADGGAPTATAEGGTTTANSDGASCSEPADPCSTLTLVQAAAALGQASVTAAALGDASAPSADGPCTWTTTADDLVEPEELIVSYSCGAGSTGQMSELQLDQRLVSAGTFVPVANVGSAAFFGFTPGPSVPAGDAGVMNLGNLEVFAGDGYFDLEIDSYGTQAEIEARAVAAAKQILSQL